MQIISVSFAQIHYTPTLQTYKTSYPHPSESFQRNEPKEGLQGLEVSH